MLERTKRRGARGAGIAAFAVATLGGGVDARALQPLTVFLERADAVNAGMRAANADAEEKDAEAAVALGRLLPALSARGVYTRQTLSQFTLPPTDTAPATTITILPENQLDAFFQLDVPIFDPMSFGRWRVSKATAEAAKIGARSARSEVQRNMVRGYHQVLGSSSLVAAARRSADVARRNLQLVRDRRGGGVASDLDVSRALAGVARAEGDLADAELTRGLAVRGLESLSGLTPTGTDAELPPDDLQEEAPLAVWMASGTDSPEARAARAALRAAEIGQDATKLAFVPTITGSASEHITNNPGLTGHNSSYMLTLTAAWRLDYALIASLRQAGAAVATAKARRDVAARSADDAVFEAWMRIRGGIAKSRAARAEAEAAAEAVKNAEERYKGGIATQLDVVTAQRDAFRADVQRVSADADLTAARSLLRLAAGRPVAAGRTP